MQEDSNVKLIRVETSRVNGGPCGGALERKKKNSRKLKSQKDGKIVWIKNDLLKPKNAETPFDPTAWYVITTKRYKEKDCEEILTNLEVDYDIRVYVAIQRIQVSKNKFKEKIVIPGKIFVQVDKSHRQAILPLCPYLKGYLSDPLRSQPGRTEFARVPDIQITGLQNLLQAVKSEVEYSPDILKAKDEVKITEGIFSESETLKDLIGDVQMVNGQKMATVVFDKIGVFKFIIPFSKLGKMGR